MLPIKNNYKSKYKDLICRGCKADSETQQHVLQECVAIHKSNDTKVKPTDYFTDDLKVLKKVVHNIQLAIQRIEQSDMPTAPPNLTVQPGIRANTR